MQGLRLLVPPERGMPMQQPVTAGQVYESCHPMDEGRQIRIVGVGPVHADVETVTGPSRPRSILLCHLHPTATTAAGQLRRTGYRLVQPREEDPA